MRSRVSSRAGIDARPGDPFADRRLFARTSLVLLLASVRYWATVAPRVRTQLSRWERHARAIADPRLQALALRKLHEERFNVEAAATAATVVGRAHRACAVEAIVALQVMYDYLDLLTEQPLPDQLADARRLFGALTDAFTPEGESRGGYYGERVPAQAGGLARVQNGELAQTHNGHLPRARDGGYLQELASTVRLALARLPAAGAVVEVARHSAARCAEAQVLCHAAARAGTAELERWATREAKDTALQWPEFRAGAAASVLSLHALIAAAAREGTTRADAEEIDAVYLSIGALTMLDSLVDHREDLHTGELGYLQHYESPEAMARRLVSVARGAAARARPLPDAAHHIMTLIGVVAYYASAPAASSAFARPVTAHVRSELSPLILPTLALMRAWRLTKVVPVASRQLLRVGRVTGGMTQGRTKA
jgi:tetraprenyl-beta-curcumene synthase